MTVTASTSATDPGATIAFKEIRRFATRLLSDPAWRPNESEKQRLLHAIGSTPALTGMAQLTADDVCTSLRTHVSGMETSAGDVYADPAGWDVRAADFSGSSLLDLLGELGRQPLVYRAHLAIARPSSMPEEAARAPAFVMASLAAHATIREHANVQLPGDGMQWVEHPDERVLLATASKLVTNTIEDGQRAELRSLLLRTLVASAIRSGHRWTRALETVVGQFHYEMETEANRQARGPLSAIVEHRAQVLRNTESFSEFVSPGHIHHSSEPTTAIYKDLASTNRHLRPESLRALHTQWERSLYLHDGARFDDIAYHACYNPHLETDSLVEFIVSGLEDLIERDKSGFVYSSNADTCASLLPALAARPGSGIADPRIYAVVRKLTSPSLLKQTMSAMLLVPGIESLPELQHRLATNSEPEILRPIASRLAPGEFSEHLTRVLRARKPSEAAPAHLIAAESLACILDSSTDDQLLAIGDESWALALKDGHAGVRLAAQLALTRRQALAAEAAEAGVALDMPNRRPAVAGSTGRISVG